MKFFWRLKKADGGEPQPARMTADDSSSDALAQEGGEAARGELRTDAADLGSAPVVGPVASNCNVPEMEAEPLTLTSNVVTLQPSRLTERIAAAALKTVTALAAAEPVTLVTDTLKPRAAGPLPGQEASYQHLARALSASKARGHILVTGRAGTGRHTAVLQAVEREREHMPRPCDWIYLALDHGRRLQAFSLPHGQGAMLTREARAAIARIVVSYNRIAASDDYRLGLEIIDEDYRQRAAKTIDLLKRRAEDQNIALVKTPEGFVLAPMHEGKVVRSEVFRSLPEAMQREVAAKIAELEAELKAFIEQFPLEDHAQVERISACQRDAAQRAVKPHLEAMRLAFTDCGIVIDALQAALVTGLVAHDASTGGRNGPLGVDVLEAQCAADFAEKAPVVFVHEATASTLCGATSYDSCGRLLLSPGALMRGNGGLIVVDAWRLAVEPGAWAALASVLEAGLIQPSGLPGVDPLPFVGRVILIGDEHALARLFAIDSGLRRHFPHVVHFPSTLPRALMGVAEYAAFAASLAAAEGLRPIAATASDALYRAALMRDGDANSIPLDAFALRALLLAAEVEAEAETAAHIRACHIEDAARRAGDQLT